MKFILIADKGDVTKNFFPLWQVLIFVVLTSLVLLLLFPRNLQEKALSYNEPSPALLNYLQALERLNPQDKRLNVAVIQQDINLGLIKTARAKLDILKAQPKTLDMTNQIAWLDYLMLRYKGFRAKINTQERIDYLTEIRKQINQLASLPLEDNQLKSLARDSLGVGQTPLALKIINHLFSINALKTPEDFAEAGSIAIQNNDGVLSAKYYQIAYDLETEKVPKRVYAYGVMNGLWTRNKVDEALAFGEHLPEDVINDPEMLNYLMLLALAANKPEIAERYAIKALIYGTSK